MRVVDRFTEVIDHPSERDLVEQAQLQLAEVGDTFLREHRQGLRETRQVAVLFIPDLEAERREVRVTGRVGEMETTLAVEHDLFTLEAAEAAVDQKR